MFTPSRLFSAAIATSILVFITNANAIPPETSLPTAGINFAGPADWNTELPLVDAFRMARPWISQQQGKPWGQGPELSLDEHGWVTRLQPGCAAETPILTIDGGHYPAGRYTLLFEGRGTIELSRAATVVSRQPGKMILDVDSSQGSIFIKISETDPADYIRNIRVIMPGFEDKVDTNPWHPAFLARWKDMRVVRFMDLMHTNNSHIKSWDDRPKMADATWSRKGIPVEMLCDLANRLQADPWFCMPHLADDDFIRQFATVVKERLDPKRRIYIEYSNEVWNGQFSQSQEAGRRGQALGLADRPWEAAWAYTGVRSKEIFAIWEDVFSGHDRLVRVLATQAANPYVSRKVMLGGDAYKHADALAIAPYMSMNIPRDKADTIVSLGLNGILDKFESESLPKSIEWMKAQKEAADEYGLRLIAYEAGQHMVGVGGGENNQALCELFQAANRHPRMGAAYRRYFAAWDEIGGQTMCVFSSTGRWSKWGSWGVFEFYDDDAKDYPKAKETLEWAAGKR